MVGPGPCRQPHATATGSPAQVPGDPPLPPQPYFGTCALTGFGQRWATARCFVQWCNFWAIWLYLGLHLEASWSCIHPPRTWRPWGGPLVILVAHCSPLYSFGAPSHSSGSQCLQGWCVGRIARSCCSRLPAASSHRRHWALGYGASPLVAALPQTLVFTLKGGCCYAGASSSAWCLLAVALSSQLVALSKGVNGARNTVSLISEKTLV